MTGAIAASLRRREPRDALVADCLQCGRDLADVVALSRGRARVSCRACGAVTLQRRSRLRLRSGSGVTRAATPVEMRPEPALAPYVSAEVIEWMRETGRDRRPAGVDKASLYRVWKEFDRAHGDRAVPSFGEVVGRLHAHCYDETAVVAELAPEPETEPLVAERVGAARRWLAGPGRDHCWIARGHDGEAVDRAVLDGVLAAGDALDAAQRQALFGAVFGTQGGPPTRALFDRFGVDTIHAAVREHLRDGSRPLREPVLAALGA
jgi:hypothetical protein